MKMQPYPTISKEMLKYFYEKEKVLTIRGDGYTIYLDGKDIVNYENELKTKLVFKDNTEKNGFTLIINEGEKLCGKIKIDISKKIDGEKYLYLYNSEKDKYQKLSLEDISMVLVNFSNIAKKSHACMQIWRKFSASAASESCAAVANMIK